MKGFEKCHTTSGRTKENAPWREEGAHSDRSRTLLKAYACQDCGFTWCVHVRYSNLVYSSLYDGSIINYCCMYAHIYSKSMDQPGKVCQSCTWSAEQEKCFFPCLRLCLRIWSRETGSAVPSRVSLLISILRLNLVLTYGFPPGSSEVPRNPLTRWDVSSTPADEIFLPKKLQN